MKILIDSAIFHPGVNRAHGADLEWGDFVSGLTRQLPEAEIVVLHRDGDGIPAVNVETLTIPSGLASDPDCQGSDTEMLEQVCRQLDADLYMGTWRTWAPGVCNVVLLHESIPMHPPSELPGVERIGAFEPIETADGFICLSEQIQRDMATTFPHLSTRPAITWHPDTWTVPSRSEGPSMGAFLGKMAAKDAVLLTAIVSTFRAAEYISGCLEDLENQTMANRMEVVVIDSASDQNEASVVREFQNRLANIKYVRTPTRESVYRAWNRGIRVARGKYITNANTDDRHRRDALEQMVAVLEENEGIALVYADVLVTRTANETFNLCTPSKMMRWHDWDRETLLSRGCFMGPQPVWRKAVHRAYGYFDEKYRVSSDYEFWLRISQTNDFYHISKPLGLYLDREDSIEHANDTRKRLEDHEIAASYRHAADNHHIIGRMTGEAAVKPHETGTAEINRPLNHAITEAPINYFDQAINQGGYHMNSPETVLNAIEVLIDGGKSEAADWALGKLLSDFPDNARLHSELATFAYQQQQMPKALDHFKLAVEIEPLNVAHLKNLGDFFYSIEKDAASALAQYERILEVKPDHVDTLVMAGHVSISQHQYADARKYYQRVVDLDPQNLEVAEILERMKASGAGGESPRSADELYQAAQDKYLQGDGTGALLLLEQLVDREHEHAPAHNDLGVLNYESGNMELARRHYETATELAPEDITFQKNLADFYWAELGDRQLALERYIQVLKLDPQDIDAQITCGQICMAVGQYDDARDFCCTVLQIEPWNEDAKQLLEQIETGGNDTPVTSDNLDYDTQARQNASGGDLQGAINDLRHLLIDEPDNAGAHNDLGVLYFEAGDKDNALRHYEQAVRIDPGTHNHLKNLADFLFIELGRAEDAMRLYLQVLEQNSEDIESLIATGMVCASIGTAEDAQHLYRRVLEIDPGNTAAQNALEDLSGTAARGLNAAVAI